VARGYTTRGRLAMQMIGEGKLRDEVCAATGIAKKHFYILRQRVCQPDKQMHSLTFSLCAIEMQALKRLSAGERTTPGLKAQQLLRKALIDTLKQNKG